MCWWAAGGGASQVVNRSMQSASAQLLHTRKEHCMALMTTGYIAQWLERLTADQQVPGSNPGVPSQE